MFLKFYIKRLSVCTIKSNNKYNISIQFSYSCMVRRHALPQKEKEKENASSLRHKKNITDKNYELPQNI